MTCFISCNDLEELDLREEHDMGSPSGSLLNGQSSLIGIDFNLWHESEPNVLAFKILLSEAYFYPGGGTSHIKGTRMVVGKLELNP